MSLVFAAITPHPPILIPNIGKDKVDEVADTKIALETLEKELYLTKPDVIFIICPHSGLYPNAFSLNGDTNLKSSFQDFGDLNTTREWQGATKLAATIASAGRIKNIPINLVSDQNLKHGASVPLFYLTNHLPNIKVLPIGYSGVDANSHLQFGELLKEIILSSNKRIAVIASGDLTHNLDKGINNYLDTRLAELLTKKSVDKIVELEKTIIPEVDECGYRSILILLGIIKKMNYNFTSYCYEHPFGVGYLTGNFNI